MTVPSPENEAERLKALQETELLDSAPEAEFDELAQMAAILCGTPVATVTLVDKDRQWFKAKVGVERTEDPREHSFCAHTILQRDMMIVPDAAADVRFADNPLVTEEPHIRFYAGVPLTTSDGLNLGTLCVIDHKPRELSIEQQQALRVLARKAMMEIELRARTNKLEEAIAEKARSQRALEIANQRLSVLAAIDGLTGLRNRRTLDEDLQREIARATRYVAPLSVMMLDIDNFKKLNDTHGHAAGDKVLQEVSDVLQQTVRASDLSARYGGEEFVVIMPNTDGLSAYTLAERVRARIEHVTREYWNVTVSIGVASLGPDVSAADELLLRADEALYSAKRSGKNRVERVA